MTGRTVKPEKPWALRLLPPFPTVANRLIALVSREDVSAKEVGEVIKLDPTFTAELLRVANSALFSVSREVTGVSHAVLLLGLERVKAMAMIVALNGMVRSAVRAEPLRRFWIHSLVTAMLTEEGARAGGMAAETAYTAGLLHNLGTLGLMSAYPEEYNRMLDVSVEYGFDLIEAERDLFDIDHCAAGAYLAREWNFPEVIVRIAFGHHEDPACGEDTLEKLVRVCWRLADALGYVAFPPQQPWGYDELLGYLGGGADSWIGAGPEQAKEEIENRLRAFR
jgi:putative nucleotidyltransferase with HDIG domain